MIHFKINLFCLLSEQLILGYLLNNYIFKSDILNILSIDDFYFKNHRIIYSVILDFFNFNYYFDIILICNKIKKIINIRFSNILCYLKILIKKNKNFNNITNYIILVHNISILRKISFYIDNFINNPSLINNDLVSLLNNIEFNLLNLSRNINSIKTDLFIIGPIFEKILFDMEILNKSGIDIIGTPTGFRGLDKMLGGFHNGELIIIAGRPSMGKTAFAINIAQNVSLNFNLPIIIFSMEMSTNQLGMRFLNSFLSLKNIDFNKSDFNDYFFKLKNVVNNFYSLKIFIDESVNLTSDKIKLKSKKIIKQYGKLGLIIIDYLQLMNSINFNNNRVMEISDISRNLKCLAKELDVPIIAISQLNRCLEFRNNKRPIMSDLRESGSIEQDADVILFIYRDEIYNSDTLLKGIAEILIAKQRNGPTGVVNLYFSDNDLKFSNY